MSVHLSVCQPRGGGNVIFSAPNWDITPIFLVQIPFMNEHLFCKYFKRLSVGNATKLCYLWMFSSLFYSLSVRLQKTYSHTMLFHDLRGEATSLHISSYLTYKGYYDLVDDTTSWNIYVFTQVFLRGIPNLWSHNFTPAGTLNLFFNPT